MASVALNEVPLKSKRRLSALIVGLSFVLLAGSLSRRTVPFDFLKGSQRLAVCVERNRTNANKLEIYSVDQDFDRMLILCREELRIRGFVVYLESKNGMAYRRSAGDQLLIERERQSEANDSGKRAFSGKTLVIVATPLPDDISTSIRIALEGCSEQVLNR
jgi:hypothetical protein